MKRRKGFTLIELLVSIAIVAILAAVAVPSVMFFIDKADKQQEETMFDDVRKNVNSAVMQMNSKGIAITMDSILNTTYQSYNGSYSSSINYDKGDFPFDILPQAAKKGKCITLELIRVEESGTYGGSGYIIRFYEDANAGKLLKRKDKKTEMKQMVIVPGVNFTVSDHGATIVNKDGNPVGSVDPPAET